MVEILLWNELPICEAFRSEVLVLSDMVFAKYAPGLARVAEEDRPCCFATISCSKSPLLLSPADLLEFDTTARLAAEFFRLSVASFLVESSLSPASSLNLVSSFMLILYDA